jgi:hypothetical protein
MVRLSGHSLEKWKFSVYLFIPILAVIVYSVPAVHEGHLNWSRYVVHPPSDVPPHYAAAVAAAEARRGAAAAAPPPQPLRLE